MYNIVYGFCKKLGNYFKIVLQKIFYPMIESVYFSYLHLMLIYYINLHFKCTFNEEDIYAKFMF